MFDPHTPLLQVAVLAGGEGTRLASLLPPGTPKVLAPVGNAPFLSLLLDLLTAQGVQRVHLCLGHGARRVIARLDEVDRAAHPGLTITTSEEATALGTAGCLRAAFDDLDDEFLVMFGDTYTPVDFARIVAEHRRIGRAASMTVLRNRDWLVPGNVRVKDDVVVQYDKSQPEGTFADVDYGIAVLQRSVLSTVPEGMPLDLGDVYADLIARRQLAAVRVHQRFYEMGTPESCADLSRRVRQRELPAISHEVGPRPVATTVDDAIRKRRLDSSVHYANAWTTVREDTIVEFDGTLAPFAVVERANFVVVLCEAQPGTVVMVEQYRHAAGCWSLELPQGGVHRTEDPLTAGTRELREETGWVLTEAEVVIDRLYEAADWATQHFAVVRGVATVHEHSRPDREEADLRVRVVALDDLPTLVAEGRIVDAATLAALWCAHSIAVPVAGRSATCGS